MCDILSSAISILRIPILILCVSAAGWLAVILVRLIRILRIVSIQWQAGR